MGSSPGVYGMNVNAVQAMSGLQGTQLSTVNSAWDQILSNATGGTAAATGFSGGIQALADLSLPAAQKAPSAKTVKSIAQALTGFTSPASQSAWAAYSSPSTTPPGGLQQVGSMRGWRRTATAGSGGGAHDGLAADRHDRQGRRNQSGSVQPGERVRDEAAPPVREAVPRSPGAARGSLPADGRPGG